MKIYKKNLLAVCGVALALGACSNEELPQVEPNAAEGREVSITFTLSVDGNMEIASRNTDVLSRTPAQERYQEPRQMLSNRSQQCVNDVRIYVFGSESQDGDFLFVANRDSDNNLMNGDGSYLVTSEGVFDNYEPWEGDGRETHNYEIRPRLKDGYYYKFLAVGRDDVHATEINIHDWNNNFPWKFGYKTLQDCKFEDKVTKFDEASIEVFRKDDNTGGLYEPNYVTEIFSGCLSTAPTKENPLGEPKSIHITPNTSNFIGTIYLTRAVAGVYARIINIPCEVVDDETGLRFQPDEVNLLLSVCATKTNLVTHKDASEVHFNDVIIGQVDFRYNTIFNPDNAWTNDGKIYLREGTVYKDMVIPANSTVMSNFVMPVEIQTTDDEAEATLIIQYYRALNNGHLIRSQKLNCTIVAVWDIESDPDKNVGPVEDPTIQGNNFKIEANKLYVLCEDYDINKPIDLSKFTRLPDENTPSDPETQSN